MTKIQTIRKAIAFNNYQWPNQLTSGIMYFEGYRITIEEFMEQCKLFSNVTK